jgi:hypothetical protein
MGQGTQQAADGRDLLENFLTIRGPRYSPQSSRGFQFKLAKDPVLTDLDDISPTGILITAEGTRRHLRHEEAEAGLPDAGMKM